MRSHNLVSSRRVFGSLATFKRRGPQSVAVKTGAGADWQTIFSRIEFFFEKGGNIAKSRLHSNYSESNFGGNEIKFEAIKHRAPHRVFHCVNH